LTKVPKTHNGEKISMLEKMDTRTQKNEISSSSHAICKNQLKIDQCLKCKALLVQISKAIIENNVDILQNIKYSIIK
jgi:uncharacterized protein with PIN domain